jgi:hypothetical protein
MQTWLQIAQQLENATEATDEKKLEGSTIHLAATQTIARNSADEFPDMALRLFHA